jgi:D-alanyl-D-alanine carboxypeptidase
MLTISIMIATPLKNFRILFVGVFLLAPWNIVAQTPTTNSKLRLITMMQRRLDAARTQGQFPGAEVGFVYVDGEMPDGKPRFASGSVVSGVADLNTNAPLKTSDRFLAGSIGKTFVATLTMMLVQDGKLNLDDKIGKWLSSESWFSKLPNATDITLRMLLNHSSGIPNHADVDSFQKQLLKSGSRNIDYEDLLAYVLNKKPLFAAGTGYNYADTNYILVGMIIEKATGKSLYDQISDRILKPFKLDRTIPSNGVTLPEVVNGYLEGKPVIVNNKFMINPQWEWAGGGLASNAEDLARWASLLYGGDVLTPKSLEEMFASTAGEDGSAYGLGTMVTRSKLGRSYGHDGEFPGYLADMRYYPKYKIAIAVMVNSDETFGVDRFLSSATEDFANVIVNATATDLSTSDQIKFRALAENWLATLSDQKFDESYNLLAARLHARFTKEVWASTMKAFAEKAGKLKSRKVKLMSFTSAASNAVVIEFESSYSKLPNASESITFVQENGVWKLSAYSLR